MLPIESLSQMSLHIPFLHYDPNTVVLVNGMSEYSVFKLKSTATGNTVENTDEDMDEEGRVEDVVEDASLDDIAAEDTVVYSMQYTVENMVNLKEAEGATTELELEGVVRSVR